MKKETPTPTGYNFFIDQETNELLKFVFNLALKQAKSDPILQATMLLPERFQDTDVEVMVRDMTGHMKKADDEMLKEAGIESKIKEFMQGIKDNKGKISQINTLVDSFTKKEHTLGWCTDPKCAHNKYTPDGFTK